MAPLRIRLTRKLAEAMEGVDLSHVREGEIIDLPEREARLLIAGDWAVPVDDEERVRIAPPPRAANAAERSTSPTRDRT